MTKTKQQLEQVITYMQAHWPSQVKPEWQVAVTDYPEIVHKVVTLWTKDATQGREMTRIAGLSGSGKTTQLLPAVEASFASRNKHPILVAARRFVEFHPYIQEIKNEYGEQNLRKMTDEFATIMMFLTLDVLTKQGYDIILDVTLLDIKIESILLEMLQQNRYYYWLTMIVVSPEITERFLGARAWRHSEKTEQEFIRATERALKFYQQKIPKTQIILWNVWEAQPVFDGELANVWEPWQKYVKIKEFSSQLTEEALRKAKIQYLTTDTNV